MKLPEKNSSEYIPAKEAAELSHYTPQAVRDWCRKKDLKAVLINMQINGIVHQA